MEKGLWAKIWVNGRVQGVGYRAFVVRAAVSLGLKGYCKNLADGRVEIVVEGERDRIDQLAEHLREGPILANVSEVKMKWQEKGDHFTDFLIRY